MKGWPVAEIATEKRRFAILNHLKDTPGYALNSQILALGAKAQGIPTTSDQLDQALDWLKTSELVALDDIGTDRIARLTTDGLEVATGERIFKGVLRPGPGL